MLRPLFHIPCLALFPALCPAEEWAQEIDINALLQVPHQESPEEEEPTVPVYLSTERSPVQLELAGYAHPQDFHPHVPSRMLWGCYKDDAPEQVVAFLLVTNNTPDYIRVEDGGRDAPFVFGADEDDPRWEEEAFHGVNVCGPSERPEIPPHCKALVELRVPEARERVRASVMVSHASKKYVLQTEVQEKPGFIDFPSGTLIRDVQETARRNMPVARPGAFSLRYWQNGQVREAYVDFRIPAAFLREGNPGMPAHKVLSVRTRDGNWSECTFLSTIIVGHQDYDSWFRAEFPLDGADATQVEMQGTVVQGGDIPVRACISLEPLLHLDVETGGTGLQAPVPATRTVILKETEQTLRETITYTLTPTDPETGFLYTKDRGSPEHPQETDVEESIENGAAKSLTITVRAEIPIGGEVLVKREFKVDTARFSTPVTFTATMDDQPHRVVVGDYTFRYKNREYSYEGPGGDSGLHVHIQDRHDGQAEIRLTPYTERRTITLPVTVSGRMGTPFRR